MGRGPTALPTALPAALPAALLSALPDGPASSKPLSPQLGEVIAREQRLPLSAGLTGLVPDGALRRGSTIVIASGRSAGGTGLALALLSAPSAAGSWCAVVHCPDLGLAAAAQLGADLSRLALVPEPGPSWPVVTAALLEGVDLVLLCLSSPCEHVQARKLEARARASRSVLIVLGGAWPGVADIRLHVEASHYEGLGNGYGYLAGRQLEVVAGGRGAASRQRRAMVCLPSK